MEFECKNYGVAYLENNFMSGTRQEEMPESYLP